MSKATLPLRLARREVLRRPGRTVLVALLVALPVAAMAGAVTLIRSDRVTPAQEWAANAGTADATFAGSNGAVPVASTVPTLEPSAAPSADGAVGALAPNVADVVRALPAGARTVTIASAYPRVRTADHRHRADVDLTDQPLGDPLTAGILDLLHGRAPAGPGEIALAPGVARRLGVHLGSTLALDEPALRLSVVGIVEQPSCLSCPTGLVAPGHLVGGLTPGGADQRLLIDLPALSGSQLHALARTNGLRLRADALGSSFGSQRSDVSIRWSLVLGAVALTVMGIVISAAFAVGARRQLVTLGQLSASGASPGTLRASLVLQGTLTGVVGVAAGLVVAVGSLVAFRQRIEELLGHRFAHYRAHVADHVVVVGVGLVAATVAALIPAVTAAGLPTLAALAGRRPLSPVSRRLVAAGFVAVVAGLGILGLAVVGSNGHRSANLWAFVAIVGGVTELLGACAIAPAIVARLEPLAGRVHGSWRIAARGLARNRARTGAVVSAVAAAGALAIVAAAAVRGQDAQTTHGLEDARTTVAVRELVEQPVLNDPNGAVTTASALPDAVTLGELDAALPGATRTTLRSAALPHGSDGQGGETLWTATIDHGDRDAVGSESYVDAMVADPAVLDAAGLSAAGRSALRRSGMVLLERHGQPAGQLVAPDGTTYVVPVVGAQHSVGQFSGLLITADRAAALHLTVHPSDVLYRNPTALTSTQRDRVEDVSLDHQYDGNVDRAGGSSTPVISYQTPRTGPSPFQLELLLTGLALVFSLFVVGASLALAAAESKDERDVLTVVGAPPAALARAAGARAGLLAGIGGLLAVPIGFLPVVVYARTAVGSFPLVFPGRTVALLVIGVPTVVGLVALTSSATAQRLRPVRVSTATFE